MKDIYEDDIGLQIVRANREGDIAFLKQMVAEQQFDPRQVTEAEHWNYLHRTNLINPSPKETIQFYLDHGVPVNAQDCYGMTPLHYAVREHNYAAAKLLLEAGADLNLENIDGLNVLWQVFVKAPLLEDVAIINLLIEHGADPYKKNKYGVPVYNALKRNAKTRPYLQELFEEVERHKPSL
ncbi:ankyrin repeat domain-containing protein [Acinetobacter sp. MD2(2019)]|uniref:ankyrin repeat domain-containing protein n=1 Tax=Acinetobacter sp. MD2(2019) TaxID=2605273 RepID=UPI002D1EEF3C|nr:ankyrin repeat domain-containing protein [Acinetobacter sp. MD2(2019)]MEB3755208.1 ankyrin repeat domain-containing protein [Acinetobacter sp. MD2(2019)]